jgi:hypothetical protein
MRSFASENETDIAEAYSGDLTDSKNTKKHKITNIYSLNDKFTMARLCPGVTKYTPASLRECDNSDYQSNTTGKVVYYKKNVPFSNNCLLI